MVAKKPRIVIIGAGMAGLTAANKLYTCAASRELFELCVVEGGDRIGGRINTSEFGGDRIEMGATWIHGIGGSPIHKIAQEINSLESDQPWECMDGFLGDPKTIAEGGFELNPSIVEPVSTLFNNLMGIAQGHLIEDADLVTKASKICSTNDDGDKQLSVGSFLRKGLDAYWGFEKDNPEEEEEIKCYDGKWTKKLLQESIFSMHENTQRTYTAAGDLLTLDFNAESEYRMFPGEEITIAKGYISVIESLVSVLPPGLIQLGRKVTEIKWQPQSTDTANGYSKFPVKLLFSDGSIIEADHVIVTVSLGVLKAGNGGDSGMFNPPLPSLKVQAISRLGYGVVNKLFVELTRRNDDTSEGNEPKKKFPLLQMAFHRPDSELRHKEIPWWMRRTASLCPIYKDSSVLLSWFAGKEALELESLSDEEILGGVSRTISCFLPPPQPHKQVNLSSHIDQLCNGHANGGPEVRITKLLKSQWGNDPLFLGSYSYVAVGSSGDDVDILAQPLPEVDTCERALPLQILFAGEATHRTHYSTTHGAYYSGLREANRILQHYHCIGF